MKRNAYKILEKWAQNPQTSPLLLRGARQVGKTWLVRELGKTFKTFIEFNLEAEYPLITLFTKYYGLPKELLKYLLNYKNINLTSYENVLLFIDEIQEAPEALLALRYFKEQIPQLKVIAAGSLIEFAINKISFPVGRIEYLYLFPLSFREYLINKNIPIDILDSKRSLPDILHKKYLKEVFEYFLIGGMPEVVSHFIKNRDWSEAQNIQQKIVAGYRNDFAKYSNKVQTFILKLVYDKVPSLIGKKIKYSEISQDYRSKEIAEALTLLQDAGLIYKCYHTAANFLPLGSERKDSFYKIYFLDSGLFTRLAGDRVSEERLLQLIEKRDWGFFTEQFVANELISLCQQNESPCLYYWHRENPGSQAEIDFLIPHKGRPLPIEVKSGVEGRARSLHRFLEEKKLERGICISAKTLYKNRSETHIILDLPFYQAAAVVEKLR